MKKGFTLIEVIVTITIVMIALPLLFSILTVILKAQIRVNRITIVKQEGDNIINLVETNVKNNAYDLAQAAPVSGVYTKACSTANTPNSYGTPNALYLIDKSKNGINYYISGTYLLQINPASGTRYLSSANTVITNFTFSCYRKNAFASPVVLVGFTISYNTTSTDPQDNVSLSYQTRIKVRNDLDVTSF